MLIGNKKNITFDRHLRYKIILFFYPFLLRLTLDFFIVSSYLNCNSTLCSSRSSSPFDPHRPEVKLDSPISCNSFQLRGETWLDFLKSIWTRVSTRNKAIAFEPFRIVPCLKRLSLAPDAPDSIHLHLALRRVHLLSRYSFVSNSTRR